MKQKTIELIDGFYERFDNLIYLKQNILNAIDIITKSIRNGKKILICGNGGSCADAEHIAAEMNKSFMLNRELPKEILDKINRFYPDNYLEFKNNIHCGIPTIPLFSMNAFCSAYINDKNSNYVFAQAVNSLGNSEDVLIAITTSGNSINVINAMKMAKVKDLKVICLCGRNISQIKDLSDVIIDADGNFTYEIQEMHLPIYHLICMAVESELFYKEDNL